MRWTRLLESAARPITGVSAAAFAALSAVRRKRIFHPYGVAFEGTISFRDSPESPLQGVHSALVRFSRGVGLPERVPDVLGLAIKFVDEDQDILFATSGETAVTRHLLIPAAGFFRRPYSTILPYDFKGASIVFGARPDPSLRTLSDQDTSDLATHVATGRVRFDLTWGAAGTNEVVPLGSLVLERPHDGDLAFNPFNSRGELRPAGALNRLRLDAYRTSQQARPDTDRTA